MPEGVFYDHNRIINQHTDTQRQPGQGHDIKSVAGKVEANESRNDRKWHGQRDNESRPPVAQK
jgi:hypothetical protein